MTREEAKILGMGSAWRMNMPRLKDFTQTGNRLRLSDLTTVAKANPDAQYILSVFLKIRPVPIDGV